MKLLRQDGKEVKLLLDIREKEEVKLGLRLEVLEDNEKQNKKPQRKGKQKERKEIRKQEGARMKRELEGIRSSRGRESKEHLKMSLEIW